MKYPNINKGIKDFILKNISKLTDFYSYVRKSIDSFGGFFVIKQFFGFLITVFIGERFLVFLNSISLFLYSSFYGIRFISEDVQYIEAIKSPFNILLPLLFAFTFFIIFKFLKFLEAEANKTPFLIRVLQRLMVVKRSKNLRDVVDKARQDAKEMKLSATTILAFMLTFVIAFGFVIYFWLVALNAKGSLWISLAGSAVIFILILISWNNKFLWYIPAVSVITIYLSGSIFLLFPANYARALRSIKHGGGIPASIQIVNQSGRIKPETYSGYLLLKTKEAYIMYDSASKKITEIKLPSVQHFEYTAQRQSKDSYLLPR